MFFVKKLYFRVFSSKNIANVYSNVFRILLWLILDGFDTKFVQIDSEFAEIERFWSQNRGIERCNWAKELKIYVFSQKVTKSSNCLNMLPMYILSTLTCLSE